MDCPIYTTVQSVKVRLANKVQFQRDPEEAQDGELPNDLLLQLILDSETEVEQDLRSRYEIPFQSKTKKTWLGLPDHSRRAIRAAVDMKAVCNILDTDFGRGTAVNAEDYKKNLADHYSAYIDKLLGRDKEAASEKRDRFRFSPPLQDMLLAATNREADDGYKGMIINTDSSVNDAVSYAERSINNPANAYVATRRGGLVR